MYYFKSEEQQVINGLDQAQLDACFIVKEAEIVIISYRVSLMYFRESWLQQISVEREGKINHGFEFSHSFFQKRST